jgi:hypothetical protein
MVRFLMFAVLRVSFLAQMPGSLMTAKQFQARPTQSADDCLAYGKEINQFGELRMPSGPGPIRSCFSYTVAAGERTSRTCMNLDPSAML